MRLDKFLKNARIIKRRTVAAEACDSSKIAVNGVLRKPSYKLKVGDVITVTFGERETNIRVTKLLEHVTKDDALSMYEIIN